MRISDVLSRDEIRSLTTPSNARGLWELGATYAVIVATFWVALRWPSWPVYIAAVVVLGGRQLALAILMHECAHHSLFASKRLNRWVGRYLTAAPIWNRLEAYRKHHLKHHSHTGQAEDPDLGLVAPFPCSRRSLLRKVARDLNGLAGLRRIVGLLGMDLGLLSYTASVGATRVTPRPSVGAMLRGFVVHTGPTLVFNAALAGLLWWAGSPELYALWVVAWMTTFGLFLRLRAIAEHACTTASPDPFLNTRTTLAGPVARALVAPHFVNYHLEHHLLMTVPAYHLPKLHRMLEERGALAESPVEPGYLAVMRRATAASA
jgi:fatty acid desaturase